MATKCCRCVFGVFDQLSGCRFWKDPRHVSLLSERPEARMDYIRQESILAVCWSVNCTCVPCPGSIFLWVDNSWECNILLNREPGSWNSEWAASWWAPLRTHLLENHKLTVHVDWCTLMVSVAQVVGFLCIQPLWRNSICITYNLFADYSFCSFP